MKRAKWFLVGLLGFCIPALMAPTGGFPYNPTFGKVNVNSATANGNYLVLNSVGAGNSSTIDFKLNGAAVNAAIINTGTASVGCVGAAVGDLCLRMNGHALRASIDSGASSSPIATVTSGSYTGTFVGCTASPTVTVLYTVMGTPSSGLVSLRFGPQSCTSNSTSFSISGGPASIRPGTTNMCCGALDGSSVLDNTVSQSGNIGVFMDTAGALNFTRASSTIGWTAAGTKGFANGVVYSYPLQ